MDLCPNCGADDFEGGSWETDHNVVSQTVTCLTCNARWTEHYIYANHYMLDEGDKQD